MYVVHVYNVIHKASDAYRRVRTQQDTVRTILLLDRNKTVPMEDERPLKKKTISRTKENISHLGLGLGLVWFGGGGTSLARTYAVTSQHWKIINGNEKYTSFCCNSGASTVLGEAGALSAGID